MITYEDITSVRPDLADLASGHLREINSRYFSLEEALRFLIKIQVEAEPTPDKTWTTDQLREEFEVLALMAPFVVVQRNSDGKKGSMQFKHSPRIYFGWEEGLS